MSRDSSTAERRDRNAKVVRFNSRLPAPILSGHAPVYLPGILFFNKVALSSAFMFVGHCQYSQKSWQTRNRIRQGDKSIMLSVPVQKDFGQSVNDTQIIEGNWRKKHLRSIQQAYYRSPYFDWYYPHLEQLIAHPFKYLGEMNMAIIVTMLDWLEIETTILDSSDYPIEGHKTDMLLSMCECARYDHYLSNEGARAYVDEYRMKDYEVTHHWQIFEHPQYEQGHRDFIPNLSAIDLLFNEGPRAANIVRSCGHIA